MLVHLDGYMKEVSVRKSSNVMFAVITLTDEFFGHISKSHSISSCLQCVYEDCNIVKSLLGHLWSQPGFDSAYHRNLTIFRLLLQWLDWQAWRFSFQIFITSAIMARWLFKAGLFTSFNISEKLLIRFGYVYGVASQKRYIGQVHRFGALTYTEFSALVHRI